MQAIPSINTIIDALNEQHSTRIEQIRVSHQDMTEAQAMFSAALKNLGLDLDDQHPAVQRIIGEALRVGVAHDSFGYHGPQISGGVDMAHLSIRIAEIICGGSEPRIPQPIRGMFTQNSKAKTVHFTEEAVHNLADWINSGTVGRAIKGNTLYQYTVPGWNVFLTNPFVVDHGGNNFEIIVNNPQRKGSPTLHKRRPVSFYAPPNRRVTCRIPDEILPADWV